MGVWAEGKLGAGKNGGEIPNRSRNAVSADRRFKPIGGLTKAKEKSLEGLSSKRSRPKELRYILTEKWKIFENSLRV